MCDTMGKLLPNGHALFGKNSDRSPNEPQTLCFYPSATHTDKTVMTTYIEVEQVPKTKAILLSQPSWLWGGEMGVNECGVCIGNEAVFTKGKYNKTGLTGMDMLRLALERSENAQMAVDCLIELLERYGQGGNCGYDHDFYYDNSFLVIDGKEIYILETAGKDWICEKTSCAAISNRLSIPTFAKKHLEPVYSYFSQSSSRKSMCSSAIVKATCIEDIFQALRQHNHDRNPLCTASVGSPCMHYGGLVGDHTTNSLVVEWDKNGKMSLWTTGHSMPCVSLFKPITFGDTTAPVFDPTYWLEAEVFHRSLLGYKLPAEFYAERDALEMEFLSSTGLDAFEKENSFFDKWKNVSLKKEKTSFLFQNNWKKKNVVFERIKRISEMEILFDSNPMTQENIQKLTNYYESPDWRSDFESDERGELPKGLKRGVLSEDGIYNLIEQ